MPSQPLHIVSFDNPYPPVYGGVIDVFFKLKALHAIGFEIYLHCFVDQLPVDTTELEKYTTRLYWYPRSKNVLKLLASTPFSVGSRYHESIVGNIASVDAPVLFEGLQPTFVLRKHALAGQKKFLRLMNIESDYYGGLSGSERNLIKKVLYGFESRKYVRYQKTMADFENVFTLSVHETDYVAQRYGNAVYVPVFHGNTRVASLSEFGDYAFYNGDLRLADNQRAALFLIDVFRALPDIKLVIASDHGKRLIERAIGDASNIEHTTIRDAKHFDELMAGAHVCVMLSFQQSGTKLKAVNALYKSRHCLINANMIDDPGVRGLCTMASTKSEFIGAVKRLSEVPYRDSENRQKVLDAVLNDQKNAQKLAEMIVKKGA
ncbi:hypothetical protein SAMN02927903_00555 [Flavobacterium caeni]|uniref:Uncharacterized protein n=2 Tax=Flavobacterium caeni TaxID=490189 RepID=A0A1G5CJ16_9FLAO|nr:hypothetical protein SAMN02927903_00555 [Flavobacterium caeni]